MIVPLVILSNNRRASRFLRSLLAGAALWLLAGAGHGAELVPLQGLWNAAWLSEGQTSLVRCEGGRVTLAKALTEVLSCVADGPEGLIMGFVGDRAVTIDGEGNAETIGRLPSPVRRCQKLADGRYLLIVGGDLRGGVLRGTHVVVWEPRTGAVERARYVPEEWNSFALAAAVTGANPATQQVVVSVRKRAPFDRTWRARPFLFAYRSHSRAFVPLWKGTSFCRPHDAVCFADLEGAGQSDVCALEILGQGQRVISTYRFDGGMTMWSTSAALALGSRLDRVSWNDQVLPVAFELTTQGGRAVAFGLGNTGKPSGVYALEPRLQTDDVASTPLAWTVLSGAAPSVLVLTAARELRLLVLRPCKGS